MNVIFQRLRTKIDTEEDYAGTEVLKIMVEIIKVRDRSLLCKTLICEYVRKPALIDKSTPLRAVSSGCSYSNSRRR